MVMQVLMDERSKNSLAKAKMKRLTNPQKEAVRLMAAGIGTLCIADTVGCEVQTIRNWKKLPQFKVALAEAIEIDAELHRFELKALYGKALQRVSELIDDKNPQIALAASKLVFDAEQNILRIAEEQEVLKQLETRMDALASNGIIPGAEEVIDVEEANDSNVSEPA